MSLFKDWEDLISNQTDESFPDFWEKYSSTEKKIYSDILDRPTEKVTGTFQSLVDKYEADIFSFCAISLALSPLLIRIILNNFPNSVIIPVLLDFDDVIITQIYNFVNLVDLNSCQPS
jgi:hypothetical protein